MPPNKKRDTVYTRLDEIRERKEQLADEMQQDHERISALWNQVFISKEGSTRSDYLASIFSKGFIAFDLFLTGRKLINTYGFLFGRSKKKKKKK